MNKTSLDYEAVQEAIMMCFSKLEEAADFANRIQFSSVMKICAYCNQRPASIQNHRPIGTFDLCTSCAPLSDNTLLEGL